jgi:hypothetical protein
LDHIPIQKITKARFRSNRFLFKEYQDFFTLTCTIPH